MIILALLSVFLISLLALFPSFQLGHFGDTWLSFFRYLQHLGPESPGQYNYLTFLLTPYGAQEILMGILQKFFGYEPTPYFIISYILRLIAAFSFYPLVFYLTRSKLATLFAILFFSITTIGFDTTDWVFNMTSYITIALFNLCLYFFLKAREANKILFLFLSAIFYYFAYIVAPVRMHGSLVLIFLMEFFYFIQNRNFKIFKKASLRFAVFLVVFLFVRFAGQSQGNPQEVSERLNLGIQVMSSLFIQGQINFIFYPVVMLGSMIIPDFLIPSELRHGLLLFIGGLLLITTIFLIIRFFKKTNISTALFMGLSWSIFSFFFAWWWVPTSIFPTTYRYFIVSAQGIAILMAAIIGLSSVKSKQILVFSFLCILILLHIIATRTYLNFLVSSHGKDISNKIWSAIPHVVDIGENKEATIFYFEGDPGTETIIHDVVTFGFPPHMALIYGLREEDGNFPYGTSNWQEVISAILAGQIQTMYGPPSPTIIERVYAFHLLTNGNLVDITNLAREQLTKLKSQYSSANQ